MPETKEVLYTSKIIKAGVLVADTKTLLPNWDLSLAVAENLDKFRRENMFGEYQKVKQLKKYQNSIYKDNLDKSIMDKSINP